MHADDDDRLIEAILASGVKIPPMPAALLEVLALAGDDRAGAREYARAIARDPALTGAVFRVVGSPVLGLRVKVDSLDKAVTLLGLATTLAVVRSEGMRVALHDSALDVVMHTLWRRMGTVAELVVAALRVLRPRGVREDIAYQAGIFHDCGVAVLCRRDPAYAQAFKAGHWPDLAALDAERHASHAVVGLMVARNWQLPAEVAETIRHHHDSHPDLLAEPVRSLAVLVRLAGHLLDGGAGADDPAWPLWQPLAEAMCEPAGLALAELEAELLGRLAG
ncbi:HDOD domain-containing protein [Parasulfuritortus cantonensis]|uniref:HDOD domain-containing protein n=1 Tax=Parasulfuritortus cantonensis TaxID=2528202 RepID=A0A4R1BGA8_9PROT|nr:HDOD domain-containing protein [Parasulfuritortus cantonensis]TCJ16256.1 HDOD domain-containing protein [Parasulfuritortus cantonensis]